MLRIRPSHAAAPSQRKGHFMSDWYVQVGQQQYGPVAEDVVRDWITQGRILPANYVWREGMSQWVAASTVFIFPNGAAPSGGGAASSYPQTNTYYSQASLKPARGGMLLTFGILGFCCIIFSILAWSMGANDLKEMDAGIMDSSGRGLTQAAKILGIIGVILAGLGFIIRIIGLAAGGDSSSF